MTCGVLAAITGVTGLVISSQAGHGPVPVGRAPYVAVPLGRAAAPLSATGRRPVARPVELVIPAIGVRTALIRLGITAAGALQVPRVTTVAGWFTGSPRPGEIGPSVIAGHVDSDLGPGIFFRLRLLRPAERIYVRRADGTLAVFRVTAIRTYRKDRFPAAAVYGPVPDPQLRLITCGGIFDPALGSYLSNVVVYAVAVGRHGRPAAGIVAPDR
jgi:sortase (surface protein transpeptidase)